MDPTPAGPAGRRWVRRTQHHGFRFEVDVPRWRIQRTFSSEPVYCAPSALCLAGPGFVPAQMQSMTAVRSVSYSGLYAFELAAGRHVRIAIVAGGAFEQREYRSSGTWDELDAAGIVIAHHEFSHENPKLGIAAVLGADLEARMTRHLGVVPQLRFHSLPYPYISIVRPGVAIRWQF
jgi:hypothetical protein